MSDWISEFCNQDERWVLEDGMLRFSFPERHREEVIRALLTDEEREALADALPAIEWFTRTDDLCPQRKVLRRLAATLRNPLRET